MSAANVLVVGDVMVDVLVRPEGPLAPGSDRRAKIAIRTGGSGANQAAWLAHFGVKAHFVGRVGARDLAEQSAALRASGVEPHLVGDGDLETGRLVALIDASGERSFFTDRGANEALAARDIPDALIAAADCICLSGYSFFAPEPRQAALHVLANAGPRPVAVDPASAEFLREVGARAFLDWTRGVALCLPNADEAEVLSGSGEPEAQLACLSRRYGAVIVKRGAQGCVAAVGERRWRVAAAPASAIDTTGAGDAFAAAFIGARLNGAKMQEALERAVAAGSAATQFIGARPR